MGEEARWERVLLRKPGEGFEKKGVVSYLNGKKVTLRAEERVANE